MMPRRPHVASLLASRLAATICHKWLLGIRVYRGKGRQAAKCQIANAGKVLRANQARPGQEPEARASVHLVVVFGSVYWRAVPVNFI